MPLSQAVDLVFKNRIPLTSSALLILLVDRIVNS